MALTPRATVEAIKEPHKRGELAPDDKTLVEEIITNLRQQWQFAETIASEQTEGAKK